MPFRFRLEPVLAVRKNLEEQLQLRLAREQMILHGHNNRLTDLQSKRRQIIAEFEESRRQIQNGARYKNFMDAIRAKEEQISIQVTTIQSQEKVVEEARKNLTQAMQKRKIIEVIKEKYAAY